VLEADLLALAVDAATTAGSVIATALTGDIDTKSTLTDMVTEVDKASEALIVGKLLAARPDDGVFGEEGTRDPGTSGVRWLIDPLDGTTNFIYRYPAYAVSIAAELDGEVVAGAVHDVVHGQTFTAHRGGGAFCNGLPLHVGGPDTLATALISTGFAYDAGVRPIQATVLAALLGSVRDVRRSGSAALDLCWVAAGRTDGYYEAGLNAWDWAAGRLVAAEAGAWVGEIEGTTVAIVPQLAEAFAAVLKEALAVAS
jgi:myo-inositol-1(or 4)-monophosphatase